MKVSVITVCYNAIEDLKKTVKSVLEQTYEDWEYIVIDGASSDGTQDYLASIEVQFASKNVPFRWISERDHGIYEAMNKGVNLACGEYINFQNAGDGFYEAETLEKFFLHPIEKDKGILFGDTLQLFDFGTGIAKYQDYKQDNPIMPFCHQSSFVKSNLMKKYHFDESYKIIADHDLFFRLHQDGIQWQYIEEIVARYNGQYGVSATNPLQLRLEGLRVHHITERWYYPLAVCWTYIRYGWIAWFKRSMPQSWSDAWMKHKRRRYIRVNGKRKP